MLNDRLAALRRDRATAEVKAAFEASLRMLDAAEVAQQALKAGDAVPPFVLPNAEGRLVDDASLLAAGPLLVVFLRGAWCPYCALTLDALEAARPALAAAGATLVALTPETGGRARAMKQQHGLHFEVLADVDLAVAMAFGIVFRTPPPYATLLASRGVDLAARQDNPALLLPIPATFLATPDGIIHRAWVDIDFTRRAEPADILAAVQALPP